MSKTKWLSFFFLLATLRAGAQLQAPESYVVKLTKAGFATTAFPFDIPFKIISDVPDNCFLVKYNYRLKNSAKTWMTFTGGSDEWKKDDGKVTLNCGGLHPNVPYIFDITIFRNVALDDKAKEDIKSKLSARLVKFAKDFSESGFNEDDVDALNKDLNDVFLKKLDIECNGTKIRKKCDLVNTYTLNIRQDPLLKTQFELIRGKVDALHDAYANLWNPGNLAELLSNNILSHQAALRKDIDAILSGKLKLNPLSAEYLKLPFSPALGDYRNYTLLDGLKVLRKLIVPPQNLTEFLKGKRKVINQDIEVADGPEYQSLYFFCSLLQFLSEEAIKDTVNHTESARFRYLQSILSSTEYRHFLEGIKGHERFTRDLAKLIAEFPDFSANIVLSDALFVEVIPDVDVITEKTPYISVEGGISYSTSFQSVRSYTGVNIYLLPVNKKARLKSFKGWNLVGKMFCFNVGVGNLFGSRPLNSYSILGSNTDQDLMLGVGLRLGRVIKVNAHWTPYKTDNQNTLSQDKILKCDFGLSVGADINIIKAFSNVGKALKLTD